MFKCQTVLLDPYIVHHFVVPLRDREELGDMITKENSTFPKSSALFNVISMTLVRGCWSQPSAVMQSVYYTAPSNWAAIV